jgi:hypothetical protein
VTRPQLLDLFCGAGGAEQAEAMPEAKCPNRRHDIFRQIWGLPKP